jgi:hypothetical protein
MNNGKKQVNMTHSQEERNVADIIHEEAQTLDLVDKALN